MIVINGAPIDGTGRVFVDATITSPVASANGLYYDATGAVCADSTNAAPNAYVAGLSFNFRHLRIADVLALTPPPSSWHNGLPFNDTDELMCSSTAPIDHHVHGWPVSVDGFVCIGGTPPPPPLGAFSHGFSNGFD